MIKIDDLLMMLKGNPKDVRFLTYAEYVTIIWGKRVIKKAVIEFTRHLGRVIQG